MGDFGFFFNTKFEVRCNDITSSLFHAYDITEYKDQTGIFRRELDSNDILLGSFYELIKYW